MTPILERARLIGLDSHMIVVSQAATPTLLRGACVCLQNIVECLEVTRPQSKPPSKLGQYNGLAAAPK